MRETENYRELTRKHHAEGNVELLAREDGFQQIFYYI